jgi:hypothetical protein
MTTRIKDEEAPYVLARIAERLMEKDLILLITTMEENKESEVYTITVTYKKRGTMGEWQC